MTDSVEPKSMLLRLDRELAESLQTVAEVEGRSVSDVAREAIASLVEQRRTDEGFGQLLEQTFNRHEQTLRRLRESS